MKGTESTTVPCDRLRAIAQDLHDAGGRMQMVYAWQPEPDVVELCYVASPPEAGRFLLWRCRPVGDPPSLASIWPSLGWYEREIMDLFGIDFRDHPEPNRLVLAEDVAPPFNGVPPHPIAPRAADIPRPLPELVAPEVQTLPFGPVRADVLELAEFTFFYVGEQILHYHPHLFFKHRGMESRFAGLSPTLGAVMAERVSGVGSVAHALAFCQAIEAAAGCVVPPRALSLRVLLAELERVYNHLHYLGHLANTTTLKVGEAQGKLLEEKAKQINARLTGSRFLRGLLIPGGLRRDLAPRTGSSGALEALHAETAGYVDLLERSDSHLDRLITTGRLTRARRAGPGRHRAGAARLRHRPRPAPRSALRRLWRPAADGSGAQRGRRLCPVRGPRGRDRRQHYG